MLPATPRLPEPIRARFAGASPQIVEFLELWNRSRHGALVPLRRELDPFQAPRLLRHVWLYQYLPDRDDFVCKLAGENVNEAWGGRLKGQMLSDVVGPAHRDAAIRRWRGVIETPCILYGAIGPERQDADGRPIAERLVLPLATAIDIVDHTIGISLYSVSQTDRDLIRPVWDDMLRIPCAEFQAFDSPDPPDAA
jgi:hypothetical protein